MNAKSSLRCAGFIGLSLLSACAVGPDYQRPEMPASAAYDRRGHSVLAQDVDGVQQSFPVGRPIPEKWWDLLKSPELGQLIDRALANNPDVEAAVASLRKAERLAGVAGAELFPYITGSYTADRKKTAGASAGNTGSGSIYNLHNANLAVSYNLDLWGGTRRAVEQAEAEVAYQGYELEAARQTLVANVVTAAIKGGALQAKMDARIKSIQAAETKMDVLQKRAAVGAASDSEVQAEVMALQKLRAALPPLQQEFDLTRYQLAALLGETPDKADERMLDFDSLRLPPSVPVVLPVRLMEQRPDLLAAEAQLKAASAAIGVALANRLPGLSLDGMIGSQASKLDRLFTPMGGVWDVGASLSQKIFDAGALLGKQEAAEAEYDRVKAVYRKSVLSALSEVAGGLRAVQNDALALKAALAVLDAQQKRLSHTQKQRDVGAAGPYEVADAVVAAAEARITVIDARASRYSDTVALFHALGGSWWALEKKDK